MKPVKPKKPKLLKSSSPPQPCNCHRGKIKEWGDGPYPDYDWVECPACDGTTFIPLATVNEIALRKYEQELTWYNYKLKRHNLLKKIRITEDKLDALFDIGIKEFKEKYLKKEINNE